MSPSLHSGRRPQHGIHGAKTVDPCIPVLARRRWVPWAALITLALLTAPAAVATAGVIVSPWGPPSTTEFPPESPPPDLGDEDADAQPALGWSGGAVGGTWNPADSTFTVGSLGDITLSGHTNIRVPSDADSALRAHENGHDQLNKHEYDQNAKKKVEDALRGFTGMKFKGEGATDAARRADALAKAEAERNRRMDRALAAIAQQMDALGAAYDDLTDHGRSDTVNTTEGVAQAIAQHALAPPAGLNPLEPDESKASCGVPSGDWAFFDEIAQRLHVAGLGLINETSLPMDPIVGRGAVHVEPFVFIGPQENGTVHLSDTYLQIVDMATGDSLLNGYLVEAAYMPANVPGFAGMIQAYLVILPPWAHGIENTIGSPFLAGMQAADDTGELTMVWLYSVAPLFDLLGTCLIPPEGVPLALTLGVAASQPGAVGDPPGAARPGLTVYPQPGRGTVRFAWKPTTGPLDLEIFDASGARRWATRLDGAHGEWNWRGRDADGQPLRAGVYFARLQGGGLDLRARVVLVR